MYKRSSTVSKPSLSRGWGAAIVLAGALGAGLPGLATAQAPALRPEVLKPLLEAQKLQQGKRPEAALQALAVLDGRNDLQAPERFALERLRATALLAQQDEAAAAQALARALDSGSGTTTERLPLAENLAVLAYRLKDYPLAARAAGEYRALGGSRDAFVVLQAQALYQAGQFNDVVQLLAPRWLASRQQAPADATEWRLLASSLQRMGQSERYAEVLLSLAQHQPSPEIWADLIQRQFKRPDLPAALELDLYRLLLATTGSPEAEDRLEHARLALDAGFPAEAEQVLQGQETPKAQTLRQRARTQLAEDQRVQGELEKRLTTAKDGNPAFNSGLNLVLAGQTGPGLALMQTGWERGGLRQPQMARLRWGYAQYRAQQTDAALATWRPLLDTPGVEADLARLWLTFIGRAPGTGLARPFMRPSHPA